MLDAGSRQDEAAGKDARATGGPDILPGASVPTAKSARRRVGHNALGVEVAAPEDRASSLRILTNAPTGELMRRARLRSVWEKMG